MFTLRRASISFGISAFSHETTAVTRGIMAYMAPEVALKREITDLAAVDVYGLGADAQSHSVFPFFLTCGSTQVASSMTWPTVRLCRSFARFVARFDPASLLLQSTRKLAPTGSHPSAPTAAPPPSCAASTTTSGRSRVRHHAF